MSIFMTYWTPWAELFKMIPYGDPYGAAFIAVVMSVFIGKRVKAVMRRM